MDVFIHHTTSFLENIKKTRRIIRLTFDNDAIHKYQIISIYQTRFRGNVAIASIALKLLKTQVPSCKDNVISLELCFRYFRSFYRKLKLKYKNDNILLQH